MIGAIIGDIIGSVYEHNPVKTTDFPLFSRGSAFTDDTVLTVAIADSLLHGRSYAETLKEYGIRYPSAGYGQSFLAWIFSPRKEPYGSWGNGSAMRVSPIGFYFSDIDEVLQEAKRSAEVTHNHPEGIKGAQATAAAIFLARTGSEKKQIQDYIQRSFGYDLSGTIDEIRPWYGFDLSCQGTVPPALLSFLESSDYEDAIRKSISLGGDSDTLACITGGIAEAYYKEIPPGLTRRVEELLTEELFAVVREFESRYGV